MTVSLYETNSDLLVLSRDNETGWQIGPATPDMDGCFSGDAAAWTGGDWEPNENDGQSPTRIDDTLVLVATYTAGSGVTLAVDTDQIGGSASAYLGLGV